LLLTRSIFRSLLTPKLDTSQATKDAAHRDYQAGAEQIVARLKKELADATREKDGLSEDLKHLQAPEDPDAWQYPKTFNEFSDMMCKFLAPMEEVSPFKLGQIQKLISDVNVDAGEAVCCDYVVVHL